MSKVKLEKKNFILQIFKLNQLMFEQKMLLKVCENEFIIK